MRPQRAEQPAKPCELTVEIREGVGQLRDLRLIPLGGAQERAQAPLDAQALTSELQRVSVSIGERVLDEGARRPAADGGLVEQGPDLGQDRGKMLAQADAPHPIMGRHARASMGRRAHFRAVLGPSLLLVLAAVTLASANLARAADPTLPTRLAKALAVPHVDPSRTAALAIDLRSSTVVFSRNPALSLQPASNEKLPIAYAALVLLGTGYRFHTEVVGTGALVGDVWHGDLFLRGYGDPTLTPADLDALAVDVASWGIKHVDGAVIGDESWFDTRRTGPGWKPSFYIGQSPPLSALVVDRGWFRGSTSATPALAAASLFRQALVANGVAVRRAARTAVLTTRGLPLAQDVSDPLAEIVRFMGRESDNYTAEVLLKHLGALYADKGSTAAGARVVRDSLAAAQIPLIGVRIADGSGLSNLDRMTASALVALLVAGIADPAIRDAFLGSLAVAGVDGTLASRLESRPARGRVIAKTGTTSVASALSGFVRDRYVFAILQNGAPISSYWARRAQDRFATALAASG